jgi:hypothetical protein
MQTEVSTLCLAVPKRYWPFSVTVVVLMLSLKLEQDGPNKTEVYGAIKASNKI